MANIPVELVAKTANCIERYGLIAPTQRVVVALSGGKDSTVLCLALRELNIPYTAAIVDIGYEPFWGAKIAEMVRQYRIEPIVLDLRRSDGPETAPGVRLRLEVLDAGAKRSSDTYTPCTYCHGAKMAALQQMANKMGLSAIALGQHQTDAVVSMIKEGLMHVDYNRSERRPFSRQRYRELVNEFAREAKRFPDGKTPLIQAIGDLTDEGVLDTDEPPRQDLSHYGEGEIIRPLFDVAEREIERMRDSLKLMTAGSGCHHGLQEETYTPREMIHYGVLQKLNNPEFDAWANHTLHIGIAPDGRGVARARSRRAELIGSDYKPVETGLDKYFRRP